MFLIPATAGIRAGAQELLCARACGPAAYLHVSSDGKGCSLAQARGTAPLSALCQLCGLSKHLTLSEPLFPHCEGAGIKGA